MTWLTSKQEDFIYRKKINEGDIYFMYNNKYRVYANIEREELDICELDSDHSITIHIKSILPNGLTSFQPTKSGYQDKLLYVETFDLTYRDNNTVMMMFLFVVPFMLLYNIFTGLEND